MIKNYKTDISSKIPEELQLLVSVRSTYNIWRVYFDVLEHEDKRDSYTTTVYETTTVTKKETIKDPVTGEEQVYEYEVEEKVPKEVTVEVREYESKFVEVTRPKSEKPTALEIVKSLMMDEITRYDLSGEVNSFSLNGIDVWLDKDTRVGLMNSTMIQKNAGLTETTLWLGTTPLKINCDTAIQLLGGLEIYALDCFNKTAEHKRNIELLKTVQDVVNYDYTAGYPEKLILKTE